MNTIEITLDEDTGMYCIDQKFKDSYQQGIRTYDIEEAKEYITNLLEDLSNEDRQATISTKQN
jgi:hypothetical protein|nr:MAG TPA: hypothetical protein [Caudoviricetes sp.]